MQLLGERGEVYHHKTTRSVIWKEVSGSCLPHYQRKTTGVQLKENGNSGGMAGFQRVKLRYSASSRVGFRVVHRQVRHLQQLT